MCCIWASHLPCTEFNAIYSKWQIVMVGDETWCHCYEPVYEISTVQKDNSWTSFCWSHVDLWCLSEHTEMPMYIQDSSHDELSFCTQHYYVVSIGSFWMIFNLLNCEDTQEILIHDKPGAEVNQAVYKCFCLQVWNTVRKASNHSWFNQDEAAPGSGFSYNKI